MNDLAPVVLFIYRRPRHLLQTLKSLAACELFEESRLIVFADGARGEVDRADVEEARRVAVDFLGDKAELHFSEDNKGLANSVIAGVNDVLARFGKVIVLEDDLILARGFLRFMNEALSRYAACDRVYQVSGYMHDLGRNAPDRPCFLPMTSSWGWGTWKRAWEAFDAEIEGWEALVQDLVLRRSFDLDGAYNYTGMLFRQVMGEVDSWAIRWYWSVFRRQGMVLYPPRSLVDNRGFDGSGSHGRGVLKDFKAVVDGRMVWAWPSSPKLDDDVYRRIRRVVWRRNGGVVGRLRDRVVVRRLMGEVSKCSFSD